MWLYLWRFPREYDSRASGRRQSWLFPLLWLRPMAWQVAQHESCRKCWVDHARKGWKCALGCRPERRCSKPFGTTKPVLEAMKNDIMLFKNLFCMFRSRLSRVKAAGGKNMANFDGMSLLYFLQKEKSQSIMTHSSHENISVFIVKIWWCIQILSWFGQVGTSVTN